MGGDVMRRRYRIVNETRWRTDDLRRFVVRAAAIALASDEKPIVDVRVRHVRARRDGVSGFANGVGGTGILLELPAWPHVPDRREIASTAAHELAHLAGNGNERAMRASARYGSGRGWAQRYAWADELPLRPKAEPVRRRPTGADLASDRLEAARRKVDEWDAKRRRAETALTKWRAKVRYYERRLAKLAAGAPPDEEER